MDNIHFEWDDKKNTLLKESRKVCFEDILFCLENDKLLDIVKNPNNLRPKQYCMIVEINNYAYVVPFVQNGSTIFLKTIYPSRKQTKKYLRSQ